MPRQRSIKAFDSTSVWCHWLGVRLDGSAHAKGGLDGFRSDSKDVENLSEIKASDWSRAKNPAL